MENIADLNLNSQFKSRLWLNLNSQLSPQTDRLIWLKLFSVLLSDYKSILVSQLKEEME